MRRVSAFFRGDDDAAGIAIDPVAEGGSERIFRFRVPLLLLIQVRLDLGDQSIDILMLVRMAEQAGAFVAQEQVFILVDDIQLGLENRQESIVLPGLVKELIVDV